MTPTDRANCPACENMLEQDRPFCPECGRLSPVVLSPGSLSVEIPDIASEQIRTDVTRLLKSWFPDLDIGAVQEALRTRWVTLIAGIDEDSGNRILDALKVFKIRGRLVSPSMEESWPARLWNPGLLVSAIALINAAIFGGLIAFFGLLAAVGAPVAWTLVESRRQRPLVTPPLTGSSAEQWAELSEDYTGVLKDLDPAAARMLSSITRAVFDVQTRLRSETVAAAIAGGEKGELYKRLRDTIRTAVELCRRNRALAEQERLSLAAELEPLRDTVLKTGEWYRSLESDGVKPPEALKSEIADITGRIDALVQEVRSPLEERLFPKEKAHL